LIAKDSRRSSLKDDDAELSIYSEIGGDDDKAHKILRVLDGKGDPKEISELSPMIRELGKERRKFTRYHFADKDWRNEVRRRTNMRLSKP
jgi:hypothetical protein